MRQSENPPLPSITLGTRILFVAPVQGSSGEAITILHMAERLAGQGHSVLFLASSGVRWFLEKEGFGPRIWPLGEDGRRNRALWDAALAGFRPDAVVFADYPYLFFGSGVIPIAGRDDWVRRLDEVESCLVTLDHVGFAQRAMSFVAGAPHLSFGAVEVPPLPERMHRLLPCPMHEPGPVVARRGVPFRYWDVPLTLPEERRREIRRRFLEREDDFLIFHSVPKWLWQIARAHALPYYPFLSEILEHYLAGLPRPATVVSVNDAGLLRPSRRAGLRFANIASLPKHDYEALLFAADLMLTENSVSYTLGKAICGLVPCAVFHNSYHYGELLGRLSGALRQIVVAMESARPGTIYPYHTLTGGTQELEQLDLYRGNTIREAMLSLEIYGGEPTRAALHNLLAGDQARAALRAAQQRYVQAVARLPDPVEALHAIIGERAGRGARSEK